MFYSNYIPVNMNRSNCAIFSSDKVFPEKKLLDAHLFLTNGQSSGISLEDGLIHFIDDPSIQWTVPEVYLAHEAYVVAKTNNFSFYMVRDNTDIPLLFVSKAFNGHRILVNALNMQSILVGKQYIVNKIASMIDKKASATYCYNMFTVLRDIESGSGKYLSGLIIRRDSDDECVITSPITTLYSDYTTIWGVDWINELRTMYNDPEATCDSVAINNDGLFIRKDLNACPAMERDFVKYLLALYDSLKEKKSNYLEILNDDGEAQFYFSTNSRYLVNAKTFECVVIKNQHTKSLLNTYATLPHVPSEQLTMIWEIAKSE